MKLEFHGGAGTVTGSKTLVSSGGARVLVDCGLFQGVKALRRRNWEPAPVDPQTLDAVILTHAHLDHTGLVPALVRGGFDGPVYCSSGTADLLGVLWPDAAHLQEEEARYRNRTGTTRHRPALPLFDAADARAALARLRAVDFHAPFQPAPGLDAAFSRAGHILGAGSLRLGDGTRSVVFSGDLGRSGDPLMLPPETRPRADVVVIESTYGGRRHPDTDPEAELAEVVSRTIGRGGTLLIPAFAVGRAQGVLLLLSRLAATGRIPSAPVYLNSPMAIRATDLFCKHGSDHRLTDAECRAMCEVATMVRTPAESKALNRDPSPKIIVSASGMATGGRILHHLEAFVGDFRSAVLFTGYQAPGTRGASLLGGAGEVKIHGRHHLVGAEVLQLPSLSAHADRAELISWLASEQTPPPEVLINHGEPASADALRAAVARELGWPSRCVQDGETVLTQPIEETK